MASTKMGWGSMLLILGLILVILPTGVEAFGAGNIPSISHVEGQNFRHGDIEDVLKSIAFLKGRKWTSLLIKRTYFGNWLRDYSQAVDIGTLKGANAETIRILVWVLSFMAFGYATAEFEVTKERLGVYRPEEHIDNPLGYSEGMDARDLDPRLRGPVDLVELEVDPRTGMKNYIANEEGGWATSAGYLRFSFARSIHYGRVYSRGSHETRGKEEDLCEALRCLGQALHCMEDFSAHSNYCELALREIGYDEVFAHVGTRTHINLRGRHVFPLTTGTFGEVDFLHSVIGEVTDNFTQSEVDEMNSALQHAEQFTQGATANLGQSRDGERGFGDGERGFGFGPFGSGSRHNGSDIFSLLGQIPGAGGDMADEARDLKSRSEAQNRQNQYSSTRANENVVPGMSPDFDPVETARKIYPILEFRDKVVRSISNIISKIPGLESLLEKIGENLTAFILGLLAPFIRPILDQLSKTLKDGSSTIIGASANSQFVVWDDPHSSNPTHSMLSKDHFTNILNGCAGQVASEIVKYTVPRVLYAWEHTSVPVEEVVNDVLRAFHHPAIRDNNIEIQRIMFKAVKLWARNSDRPDQINYMLSSQSVKDGKNHILKGEEPGKGHSHGHSHSHSHGGGGRVASVWESVQEMGGHGKVKGSLWSQVNTRSLDSQSGSDPSGQPLEQPERRDYHKNPNYWDEPEAPPEPQPSPGYPQFGYTQRPSGADDDNDDDGPGGQYAPPQPQYGQAQYEQMQYGRPQHGQYQYGQSQYGQPQPQYGQPQYGQPPSGPPQYGQPQYGQPQPSREQYSYDGGAPPGFGLPPMSSEFGGPGYGPPQSQYEPPSGPPPPNQQYGGTPGGYQQPPYPPDRSYGGPGSAPYPY